MAKLPDLDRVNRLLRYDKETGLIYWRETRNNNAKSGCEAGTKNGRYRYVEIDGCSVGVHRVAWAIENGKWATRHIDHINCDPSDNRIENLREATREENLSNQRKAHAGSATGVLGVYKSRGSYAAIIQSCGRQYHLGRFATVDLAAAAYAKAKAELHGVQL